ncbi:diguanylate cyclase [Rhodoferax sp.]|uniref:bifunctional diguanylate cyclase/phosphodiesterase n=1 Tax=Rhodoferax sp. TaxID=50421 RepID=UPI002604FB87|nr:diguanylate cyclase [Rhodoferax sp.]MDD2809756.1 diguanylate cyclase [Rhodoferax sp.]
MNLSWKSVQPYLAAWLAAALAVLAVLTLTRYQTTEDWQLNEKNTRVELANLSRLTQEHASRTLHAADQALQLIRLLYLRDGDKLDLGLLARQGAIDLTVLHQVGIIDAQGVYRLSNLPQTPPVNLVDREHFRVHVGSTQDRLFISKPVLGRVSGKWTVQLTRAMHQPDGSFAGVAVVSLDADYFNRFYASLNLGAQGSASLVGLDGVVRARRSPSVQGLGVHLTQSPALALLARGQTEGFYENVSVIDGIMRLHHFRQLTDLPFYVTVGYGRDDYQSASAAEQHTRWVLAGGLCVPLVLLAALFNWHRWREQRQVQALQASHAQMDLALQGGGLGLWRWDLVQGMFEADARLHAILGFQPGELEANNANFMRHLHPDDVHTLRQQLPAVLKGQTRQLVMDHRLKHKDGHWVWLMARGQVVQRNAQGRATLMVGTDVDSTQQKLEEAARDVAAVAFESSAAMMVCDVNQVILRVNQAFVLLTGYSVAESVGQPSKLLKSGRHSKPFYAALWQSMAHSGHWEGEIWNRRKDGEVFLDWLSITVVKNAQGQATHYVAVHSDITLRKRTEEEVRQLAFFDPLTQLPNRRLLQDRLQQLCAAYARNNQLAAVLFIDLDRFKQLNDTHGHDQGDELLMELAQRLLACVREVDSVARLGGDEFVVALAQLGEDAAVAQASALAVAQKILLTVAKPFTLSRVGWELSASIGVAMVASVHCEPEALLKSADAAMYQAKAAGRNAVRLADQAS